MKDVKYALACLALCLGLPALGAEREAANPPDRPAARESLSPEQREARLRQARQQLEQTIDRLERKEAALNEAEKRELERARTTLKLMEFRRKQLSEPGLDEAERARVRELENHLRELSGRPAPLREPGAMRDREQPDLRPDQPRRPREQAMPERPAARPSREPGWQPPQGLVNPPLARRGEQIQPRREGGLSPDQQVMVREILGRAREKGRDLNAQLRRATQELREICNNPRANEDEMRELAMRIGKFQGELALIRARTLLELRRQLGPEQFAQVRERLQRWSQEQPWAQPGQQRPALRRPFGPPMQSPGWQSGWAPGNRPFLRPQGPPAYGPGWQPGWAPRNPGFRQPQGPWMRPAQPRPQW